MATRVRLSRTRRPNLLAGGIREAELTALIQTIREARAAGRGLSVFVWINGEDDRSPGAVSIDLERPREGPPARGGGRPIGSRGSAPAPAGGPGDRNPLGRLLRGAAGGAPPAAPAPAEGDDALDGLV